MANEAPTLNELLAERLQEIRAERAWTQADMAAHLRSRGLVDWNRSVVNGVENQIRRVTLPEVLALSLALEEPLQRLVTSSKERIRLTDTTEIRRSTLEALLEGADPRQLQTRSEDPLLIPSEAGRLRLLIQELRSHLKRNPGDWIPLIQTVDEAHSPASASTSQDDSAFSLTPLLVQFDIHANIDDWFRHQLHQLTDEMETRISQRAGFPPTAVTLASLLVFDRTASEQYRREAEKRGSHIAEEEIERIVIEVLRKGPTYVVPRAIWGSTARPPGVDTARRSGRLGGRYQPLFEYLQAFTDDHLHVQFEEVERLLGRPLPDSARKHRAWWANDDTHSHARAWMAAGWNVESADVKDEWVDFVRPEGRQ